MPKAVMSSNEVISFDSLLSLPRADTWVHGVVLIHQKHYEETPTGYALHAREKALATKKGNIARDVVPNSYLVVTYHEIIYLVI